MTGVRRGPSLRRRWPVVALGVGLVLPVMSCSESGVEEEPAEVPSAAPAVPALVGTWERETTCDEVVAALTDAGLEAWITEAVAGNSFIPGVTSPDEIADPADPCRGAVPRVHSHFFTDDGRFGSLDWNGDPVDDGTYEITDDGTFVVSKEFPDVTFRYTIEGDTISFDPVIPKCSPDCFEAAWSVMVAYPGETWERSD
jgi:hypothetical protein